MQKLPSALFGIGLVALLMSVVVGWIIAPIIIEEFVTSETRFYNGSFAWNKWINITNEIHFKVYMFNVTNPDEVEKGELPVLQEMGPYVYEEKREKFDVRVHEENDTIEFRQKTFFYFRPDLSDGVEEDVITTINIPLVIVSQKLANFPTMIRFLVGMYLMKYKETLFIQKTVGELLFKGYKSKMVDELQSITGEMIAVNNTVGIYYHRNGTDEGVITIHAGNKQYSKFNEVASFEGDSKLKYWPGEACNKIQGTDANSFPPFINKKLNLYVFQPDICRTAMFKYNKNVEFRGIPGYNYLLDEQTFAAGEELPENECFCLNPGENRENCHKSGVQPLSSCQRGAPITISFPHFLHAPSYLNKTIGLNPQKELHTTYVEIEPTLGILLQGSKKGQVNVDLKPVKGVEGFRKLQAMQFPVLWQDEVAIIDDEVYLRTKSEFQLPLNIFDSARWAALAVSCVILSFSVSVLAMRSRKKDYFV